MNRVHFVCTIDYPVRHVPRSARDLSGVLLENYDQLLALDPMMDACRADLKQCIGELGRARFELFVVTKALPHKAQLDHLHNHEPCFLAIVI